MKFRYINKERILILALAITLLTVTVFSQDTYFMPGVQSGYAFTMDRVGDNYFAKNRYGQTEYSGSNFTQVFLDSANSLQKGVGDQGGGLFKLTQGTFVIDSPQPQ